MNKKITLLLLILSLFFSCKGSHSNNINILGEPVSESTFMLGTSCFITIYALEKGSDPSQAISKAFDRVDTMEQNLSVNIEGSEIEKLNKAQGKGISLSPDSLRVLEKSLEIAKLSSGRFDPTIGQLVKDWGIATDHPKVPSSKQIKADLETIDYKGIAIADGVVTLLNPKASLDLGGIAKGHAADLVKQVLIEEGVTSAIINLGGNVDLLGAKPDGSPWRIGIQDPKKTRGEYLGILTATNKAVVTSGIYERFFEQDGKHYHHILDTKTGFPVDNGLESTTVITTNSMLADGLSTSLFSLGIKEGLSLAETLDNVDVIYVDNQKKVYYSKGLEKVFKITNSKYTLAKP